MKRNQKMSSVTARLRTSGIMRIVWIHMPVAPDRQAMGPRLLGPLTATSDRRLSCASYETKTDLTTTTRLAWSEVSTILWGLWTRGRRERSVLGCGGDGCALELTSINLQVNMSVKKKGHKSLPKNNIHPLYEIVHDSTPLLIAEPCFLSAITGSVFAE